MGPAEIVASLKELCEQEGPLISTQRIVRWIEQQQGFDHDAVLIAFAKKMKARNLARRLMYFDEETGVTIKRLWSARDRQTGERFYHDVAQLAPERRRKLIRHYQQFTAQLANVRRAMADSLAGQGFFDFYTDESTETDAAKPEPPIRNRPRSRPIAPPWSVSAG